MIQKSRITNNYIPIKSLVVYKQPSVMSGDSDNYYIEESPVIKSDGKYKTIGYSPLKLNALLKIASVMVKSKIENFDCFVPKNVIFFDKRINGIKVAWKVEDRTIEIIHKEYGKIKVSFPTTIFFFDEDEIKVFCSKEFGVGPETDLYHMPLPNIYENGKICLGDTNIPEDFNSIQEIIDFTHKFFYHTEFNEYHNKTPYKNNVHNLLKSKEFTIYNKLLVKYQKLGKCIK